MIEFTIPGVPVGKARPRFARVGKFVKTFTPEKTASYENLVKLYASQAMAGKQLLDGPVDVAIILRASVPESWSWKKKADALAGLIYPITRPDIDNVVKGIFDALNEIVWRDDKQVVFLAVLKEYSDRSEALVRIKPFDPEQIPNFFF